MALAKIELAKARIALYAGFWIALTAKLEWIADPTVDTACTNGKWVRYNPDWMEALPLSEAVGVALHEVAHCMFSHPSRCLQLLDNDCKQVATDIVVNRELVKYFAETPQLKAALPSYAIGGPQFDKYDGWNVEKIYLDLLKRKKAGELFKPMDQVVSCKDDGTPMTATEAEALSQEWIMAAQQAATMAKARGVLPGMWGELVAGMVEPKVNWRAQLWDIATKIADDEPSWRRFNRRFLHDETYLPGKYSEKIGRVCLIADTSGSMNSEEFKLGLGAINEVFEELNPEAIRFIQCDTRVVHDELLIADDLPLTSAPFKGRGGTVLTPAFELIAASEHEPELVICLTDGDTDTIDPALEPKCPMVWLVTTNHTQAAENSFGKIIRVEV